MTTATMDRIQKFAPLTGVLLGVVAGWFAADHHAAWWISALVIAGVGWLTLRQR